MIERDEAILETTATAEAGLPEREFEVGLRPQTLADFIGQNQLKENLKIFIEAAKKRKEPMEHVLLYGNPGLGKTTLAHILANEMGAQIRVTSGPALERVGDLAAILSNLGPGDILFIDEIHRFNKSQQDALLPYVEKGDFILIGATTEYPKAAINPALLFSLPAKNCSIILKL